MREGRTMFVPRWTMLNTGHPVVPSNSPTATLRITWPSGEVTFKDSAFDGRPESSVVQAGRHAKSMSRTAGSRLEFGARIGVHLFTCKACGTARKFSYKPQRNVREVPTGNPENQKARA